MFFKNLVIILLLLFSAVTIAQTKLERGSLGSENNLAKNDSTRTNNTKGLDEKAIIDMYKIISHNSDTTHVDTTLSIHKEYKFNYLRKDNFGLMPFSNIGQTYNSLIKKSDKNSILPIFGARARHFNYMEVEDIDYYYMPTPLTELFFKTAFEQGQVLDAFFSVNTSPQFNFSIAYKGLRSLGNYQHILTSTGNFRITTNYHTKNNRYNFRAHIVTQDLLNQENGGIKDDDIESFESGNEEFIDRAVFDPQFENAENILRGKRFYLNHEYIINKPTDSLVVNSLAVGQIISFEDKYYEFNQTLENEFFGDAFVSAIYDRTTLENFHNQLYLDYQNISLGSFRFNLDYHNYNYGYNSVTILDDEVLPNRIKGNTFSLGAQYRNNFNKLYLHGEILANISGSFDGSLIAANANYVFNDDLAMITSLKLNSSAPNFNYLLYKSDYINYNWNNIDSFDNVNTKQLVFNLKSSKIADIAFDYTSIDNYTFFSRLSENEGVKPFQSSEQINYFKVKLSKEIKYGKFALDNTIMYQNVLNGDKVFNVPSLISRNTLYYSNHFFKKALYLQTGITLNYFTDYNMDSYDPLLAEFYTQNDTKVGDFPRLDFFVNAKIRQTRIFFKIEHFNSGFTGYDYFSAPNYPYRDFAIRFGLVWNFFL